jgi:hypothetical protein
MSTLTSYEQQVTTGSFKDAILGQVVWYSIPEETIPHDTVLQACKAQGIEGYAPAIPRPPDVFRRACKAAHRRIGRKDDPQRFTYEFKSIDHDDQQIFVKLVRETVDAKTNKGIEWARMANVTFQRDTHIIDVVELPDLDDEGRDALRVLKQTFTDENGKVNSAHLRRMIQQVLSDCLATAIRPSGGIYFVTESNSEKLRKLSNVINGLPNGTSMHLLPLLDTADQRQMLQGAIEAELADEMDANLSKIVETLKAGSKISADRFTQLTANLHRSGRKGNAYAQLLSKQLATFEDRKKIASEVVAKLANLVDMG